MYLGPADLDSPVRSNNKRKSFREKSQNRQKKRNNETNQRTKRINRLILKEFIPKETMKENEYEGNNFKP